jgi:Iron-containing redox enzyme
MDMASTFAELPRLMAQRIRPLYHAPTRALYVAYLQQMAAYTRFAGEELRHAARLSEGKPVLQEMFLALADEEESHHLLAEADLRALAVPLALESSVSVIAYRTYWNSVPSTRAWCFAGALYALENVAAHAGPEALKALSPLQLEPSETRFVRAHLAADDAHGERLRRCCSAGMSDHEEDIVAGAKCASELWVAMHLSILEQNFP